MKTWTLYWAPEGRPFATVRKEVYMSHEFKPKSTDRLRSWDSVFCRHCGEGQLHPWHAPAPAPAPRYIVTYPKIPAWMKERYPHV